MKKISVVIPVFNLEKFINPLFNELKTAENKLKEINLQLQLIFVNDGSRDSTWDCLIQHQDMFSDIILINLTKNFGAICASNAGIKYIEGDCFTIYAGDLQDPIDLIPKMAQKWQEGYKYIISIRNKNRKDPLLTIILSRIYYKLITWFVVKDFPKSGFDIALWDSSLLDHLKYTSKNINRSLFAHWLGFEPYIFYYDRPKRKYGESGWNFSKKIKLFIDSIVGFSVLPIRFILFIGFIASFLSLLYGIIVFIGGINGTIKEPGFAAIVCLITFMLGLVITILGVIGEYIWRIFDEVNKRPESVIDEVLTK